MCLQTEILTTTLVRPTMNYASTIEILTHLERGITIDYSQHESRLQLKEHDAYMISLNHYTHCRITLTLLFNYYLAFSAPKPCAILGPHLCTRVPCLTLGAGMLFCGLLGRAHYLRPYRKQMSEIRVHVSCEIALLL